MRRSNLAVVAAVIVLQAACGSPPPAPESVAKAFWQAMLSDQIEQAGTYASKATITRLPDLEVPSADDLLLGEALSNDTAAVVRTSLSTRDEDVALNIVFSTYLVLEEGEWRVDVAATHDEVVRATFAAGMRMVGEAIGEGLEDFGEALEQGAEEVRDAIIEALEDRKHDDF
jgi:hypothetical protein